MIQFFSLESRFLVLKGDNAKKMYREASRFHHTTAMMLFMELAFNFLLRIYIYYIFILCFFKKSSQQVNKADLPPTLTASHSCTAPSQRRCPQTASLPPANQPESLSPAGQTDRQPVPTQTEGLSTAGQLASLSPSGQPEKAHSSHSLPPAGRPEYLSPAASHKSDLNNHYCPTLCVRGSLTTAVICQ